MVITFIGNNTGANKQSIIIINNVNLLKLCLVTTEEKSNVKQKKVDVRFIIKTKGTYFNVYLSC